MSPKKDSQSEEYSLPSPQISKGLVLQSVASRGAQNPETKLQRNHQSISKSAQAINRYYHKMTQIKNLTSPSGFACEIEEIRKAFLMRPGCPQFGTRATSVSHMGSATTVDLPRDTCVSSGSWKMTEDQLLGRRDSAMSMDGHLIPSSRSACELNYPYKESEPPATSPSTSSPVMVRRSQRTRMPWYISVINEKDHSLLMLEEELQRLSELETQVQKKDQEILALQKEKEALRKQLRSLLRSKGPDTTGSSVRMERSYEIPLKHGRMSFLKMMNKEDEELQRWMQMQEEYVVDHSREMPSQLESFLEEKSPEGVPEETVITTVRGRVGAVPESTKEELEEAEALEEEEGVEEEEEGDTEEMEEEMLWELREEEEQQPRKAYSLTGSFEEELIAHMEEYEHMLMEFQNELGLTRARYSLATGAITSLQRQVDFQESQMRKLNTENELLEKELRERKRQIQAMTEKFSSLHEEKKHQEIMGFIEKDNLGLRQKVSDMERELTKREQTITELSTKVTELEAQVNLSENHLQRWRQLHDELQGRNETIQQAEQQTRVILENSQARLERLRNKIIQAAFSVVGGVKNLSTEISDNCILEALQRIISERSDFYNQLRQKGVKVPPLQQSDISLPSKTKKISPNNRALSTPVQVQEEVSVVSPSICGESWPLQSKHKAGHPAQPGLAQAVPRGAGRRPGGQLDGTAAGSGSRRESGLRARSNPAWFRPDFPALPGLASLLGPRLLGRRPLAPPLSPRVGWRRPLRSGRGEGSRLENQPHFAFSPGLPSSGKVGSTDQTLTTSQAPEASAPPGLVFAHSMQTPESGVHYSRWENSTQDEVSMTTTSRTEETSCCSRLSQKLCTGKLGITMKVLGGVTLFWIIFILGYITGYYVHKCK